MRLSDERGWFTPGGHPDFWGDGGTYSFIPDALLPPLDAQHLDETFAWLPPVAARDSVLGFEEAHEENLERALAEAKRDQLVVPPALTKFLTTPAIHGRVQTCTACYLDLSRGLLAGPDGSRLFRILNDQQSVLLWYLQLLPDGTHQVLVGAPEWHEEEPPGAETLDELIDPGTLRPCAPGVMAFLYRFWIENAIWYGLHYKRPLTPLQELYRRAALTVRDQLAE
jgi:hypothetical protein